MNCPLCNTPLPDNATECTRCDWVLKVEHQENLRDLMAFWLSLVPGLGHLYKGHVLLGGVIFFIIGPAALLTGGILAPATLGVSLVIPLLFMVSGMIHAYRSRDLRTEVAIAAREFDNRIPAPH